MTKRDVIFLLKRKLAHAVRSRIRVDPEKRLSAAQTQSVILSLGAD